MRHRRCDADGVALRCLIIDDNAAFLEAAAALLERQGLAVVGVASNGADALARSRELRPDVVVLDIALGPESGFDVARDLAAADPDGAKVVLTSTHEQEDFADLIDASPAVGFVAKPELSASAIARLAGQDGRS